jgi:hypothetical protein
LQRPRGRIRSYHRTVAPRPGPPWRSRRSNILRPAARFSSEKIDDLVGYRCCSLDHHLPRQPGSEPSPQPHGSPAARRAIHNRSRGAAVQICDVSLISISLTKPLQSYRRNAAEPAYAACSCGKSRTVIARAAFSLFRRREAVGAEPNDTKADRQTARHRKPIAANCELLIIGQRRYSRQPGSVSGQTTGSSLDGLPEPVASPSFGAPFSPSSCRTASAS